MDRFASNQNDQALAPVASESSRAQVQAVSAQNVNLSGRGQCKPAVFIDPAIRRVLGNRLLVTGLLLLIGPLGLPALWLNRRFSPVTKILGTLGFVALTIVLPIALTWYWCHHALQPLVDTFDKLQ